MGNMASVVWEADLAAAYDDLYVHEAEPTVVGPIAGVLARLAGGGAALEFAVGTGRVALPLSAQGVAVSGIELLPHMGGRMRAKPGADAVPVIVGDMTTTRAGGSYAPLEFMDKKSARIGWLTRQNAESGRPAGQ